MQALNLCLVSVYHFVLSLFCADWRGGGRRLVRHTHISVWPWESRWVHTNLTPARPWNSTGSPSLIGCFYFSRLKRFFPSAPPPSSLKITGLLGDILLELCKQKLWKGSSKMQSRGWQRPALCSVILYCCANGLLMPQHWGSAALLEPPAGSHVALQATVKRPYAWFSCLELKISHLSWQRLVNITWGECTGLSFWYRQRSSASSTRLRWQSLFVNRNEDVLRQ